MILIRIINWLQTQGTGGIIFINDILYYLRNVGLFLKQNQSYYMTKSLSKTSMLH